MVTNLLHTNISLSLSFIIYVDSFKTLTTSLFVTLTVITLMIWFNIMNCDEFEKLKKLKGVERYSCTEFSLECSNYLKGVRVKSSWVIAISLHTYESI